LSEPLSSVLCCVRGAGVIRCRLEAGNRPRNEVVRLTKPVNLKPKSIHESEASTLSLSPHSSLSLSSPVAETDKCALHVLPSFFSLFLCLWCVLFNNLDDGYSAQNIGVIFTKMA